MRIAFGLMLVLVLSSPIRAEAGAEPPIRIGVSTALTGEAATYGQDVLDALRFAVEELAPGRYQLIVEDDRCSSKDAVSIAQKFVSIDRVKAVIGPACSGSVLSAAPIYEKGSTLVIVTNASAPKISQAGDYIFRTSPSDAALCRILFEFISKRAKHLGILSEQTDYAQGLKEIFTGLSYPGFSISNEDFLSETTDFRSLLSKLQRSGIDSLFLNTQSEQNFIAALKQIRQLKLPFQLYGAYWPSSPSLLKQVGSDAQGIIFADTPGLEESLNTEGKRLFERYTLRFGPMRGTASVFATTFEGFRALDRALQSGEDPKRFLYRTKFDGVFGPYTFDANGELQGLSFVMKQIENGKAVLLRP